MRSDSLCYHAKSWNPPAWFGSDSICGSPTIPHLPPLFPNAGGSSRRSSGRRRKKGSGRPARRADGGSIGRCGRLRPISPDSGRHSCFGAVLRSLRCARSSGNRGRSPFSGIAAMNPRCAVATLWCNRRFHRKDAASKPSMLRFCSTLTESGIGAALPFECSLLSGVRVWLRLQFHPLFRHPVFDRESRCRCRRSRWMNSGWRRRGPMSSNGHGCLGKRLRAGVCGSSSAEGSIDIPNGATIRPFLGRLVSPRTSTLGRSHHGRCGRLAVNARAPHPRNSCDSWGGANSGATSCFIFPRLLQGRCVRSSRVFAGAPIGSGSKRGRRGEPDSRLWTPG